MSGMALATGPTEATSVLKRTAASAIPLTVQLRNALTTIAKYVWLQLERQIHLQFL